MLLTLEPLLCGGIPWLLTVDVVVCEEEDTLGEMAPLLELETVTVDEVNGVLKV